MLKASVDNGGRSMSTGSDTASAPGAIVTPPAPPKVRAWSVAGSIVPGARSGAGFATWAAPMTSGYWPVALEKRTRAWLPPALSRTNVRKVS